MICNRLACVQKLHVVRRRFCVSIINSSLCDIFLPFCKGLDEEGLYRISGQTMDIDELKEEFETSACVVYLLYMRVKVSK